MAAPTVLPCTGIRKWLEARHCTILSMERNCEQWVLSFRWPETPAKPSPRRVQADSRQSSLMCRYMASPLLRSSNNSHLLCMGQDEHWAVELLRCDLRTTKSVISLTRCLENKERPAHWRELWFATSKVCPRASC